MSDIRKLLDIINETTVAGSVAPMAAPLGKMQERVEETTTEETKKPEVIEYGMWENSALATTSKLKKNRGKSAKVVKSIYGEDVQSEAANPKQQAAIAIAKKKDIKEGVAEAGYQSPHAKLAQLKAKYEAALKSPNPNMTTLRRIRDEIIKLEFDLGLKEGVAEGFSDVVKGVKRFVKGKEHPDVVAAKHAGRAVGHYNQGDIAAGDKESQRYVKTRDMHLKAKGVAEGLGSGADIIKLWKKHGNAFRLLDYFENLEDLKVQKYRQLVNQIERQCEAEFGPETCNAMKKHSRAMANVWHGKQDRQGERNAAQMRKQSGVDWDGKLDEGMMKAVAEGSDTYKQGHAKFHTKTNKQVGPTHYGRGSEKKADNYTKADPRYHEVRPVKEQGVAEDQLEESDLILNPSSISKKVRDLIPHAQDRTDHEVEMAKGDLYQAGKDAVKIFELIRDISEEQGLEGWVQEKIIKAADYLNIVREYLESKQLESMDGVAPGTKMFTSEEKPGLWANIHAKRKRIKSGSGEHMRKPGSKGAPSAQDFKDAAK